MNPSKIRSKAHLTQYLQIKLNELTIRKVGIETQKLQQKVGQTRFIIKLQRTNIMHNAVQ